MNCPCGAPLHYTNPESQAKVEALIAQHGETVQVAMHTGTWRVPRHYIALHGLRASALPTLAQRYGWEPVTETTKEST